MSKNIFYTDRAVIKIEELEGMSKVLNNSESDLIDHTIKQMAIRLVTQLLKDKKDLFEIEILDPRKTLNEQIKSDEDYRLHLIKQEILSILKENNQIQLTVSLKA
jgi:hypothetical protein